MKKIMIALAIGLSGCATQPVEKFPAPLSKTEVLLDSGVNKLADGGIKDAIVDFDRAIVLCANQYANSEKRIYSSRGMRETLYYMLKATADREDAITTSPTCSDVLYFRGYAALDFGQVELAEEYIKKAIDMAPVNSRYLSELGHIYQLKRDWGNALEIFTKAEEAASTYSPHELKDAELIRAKRGVGYSLIELKQLDKAENKFKECLVINKNDQATLKELEYIESLRSNVPADS